MQNVAFLQGKVSSDAYVRRKLRNQSTIRRENLGKCCDNESWLPDAAIIY